MRRNEGEKVGRESEGGGTLNACSAASVDAHSEGKNRRGSTM